MEHKTYVFDYEAFIEQLADRLENALLNDRTQDLCSFIEENKLELKDPYEGFPLESAFLESGLFDIEEAKEGLPLNSWKNILKAEDVQEYGDIALTKFYDPGEHNIGLVYDWQDIEDILSNELSIHSDDIILGEPFGPIENRFDPGRMGSYFQSSEQVKENMQVLQNLVEQKPELAITLADLISMLQKAIDAKKGLYITF